MVRRGRGKSDYFVIHGGTSVGSSMDFLVGNSWHKKWRPGNRVELIGEHRLKWEARAREADSPR